MHVKWVHMHMHMRPSIYRVIVYLSYGPHAQSTAEEDAHALHTRRMHMHSTGRASTHAYEEDAHALHTRRTHMHCT